MNIFYEQIFSNQNYFSLALSLPRMFPFCFHLILVKLAKYTMETKWEHSDDINRNLFINYILMIYILWFYLLKTRWKHRQPNVNFYELVSTFVNFCQLLSTFCT